MIGMSSSSQRQELLHLHENFTARRAPDMSSAESIPRLSITNVGIVSSFFNLGKYMLVSCF